MATQEERITTVEYGLKQFQTETIKAYQEMALEITMVKGLSEDSVKRLMTMKTTLDQHTTILHEHTALLTQILERLPKTPQS